MGQAGTADGMVVTTADGMPPSTRGQSRQLAAATEARHPRPRRCVRLQARQYAAVGRRLGHAHLALYREDSRGLLPPLPQRGAARRAVPLGVRGAVLAASVAAAEEQGSRWTCRSSERLEREVPTHTSSDRDIRDANPFPKKTERRQEAG